MDNKFLAEGGFVGNKPFVIAAVLAQEIKDMPVLCEYIQV